MPTERPQRRSLLSGTPRPVVRSARPGPRPEDAPPAPPRPPTIPPTLPAERPPDPTAVDFDFEPEDLPLDALQVLEIVDLADIPAGAEAVVDETPMLAPEHRNAETFSLFGDDDGSLEGALGPVRQGEESLEDDDASPAASSGPGVHQEVSPQPPRTPHASPMPTAGAPPVPASTSATPLRSSHSPLWRVPVVFVGSMAVTMVLALVPWFSVLSPRLHDVQAAQRAERQAATRIVEVPAPQPVVVERIVAPEQEEPEEAEPTEEDDAVQRKDLSLSPPPATRRSPRKRPSPKPSKPTPAGDEADTKSASSPPAEPEAKPSSPPAAPPEARALDGRYGGTSKGEPILFDLQFLANGILKATIQRGADRPVATKGRYSLAGERATIALVEPTEGGASYSATVSSKGISGRINHANGKNHRFSLDR